MIVSCKQKEDVLITTFDKVYNDILDQDHMATSAALNDKSRAYLDALSAIDNQNIDSVMAIGQRYRLPYITTEFMAYYSEDLSSESADAFFYEYLGSQDASIFSFKNAFYIDKAKIKKGKEIFIPVIKEEMSENYLKWTRWTGNDAEGYLLDLMYIVELAEIEKNKSYKQLRQQRGDVTDRDAFLRGLYWQNSGPSNTQFKNQEKEMYENQRTGRAEILNSYRKRGLIG